MGLHTYNCKCCNQPATTGEEVRIYHLDSGEVVSELHGDYSGYGDTEEGEWDDWDQMVDDHFDRPEDSGIALIHEKCWTGKLPKNCSTNPDDNQG